MVADRLLGNLAETHGKVVLIRAHNANLPKQLYIHCLCCIFLKVSQVVEPCNKPILDLMTACESEKYVLSDVKLFKDNLLPKIILQ